MHLILTIGSRSLGKLTYVVLPQLFLGIINMYSNNMMYPCNLGLKAKQYAK